MAEISQSGGFCNTKRDLRRVSILHLFLRCPTPSAFQRAKNLLVSSENGLLQSEMPTGLLLIKKKKKSESIHPSHWWFCLIRACLFFKCSWLQNNYYFHNSNFLIKKEKEQQQQKKNHSKPFIFPCLFKKVLRNPQQPEVISNFLPAPGLRDWQSEGAARALQRCLQVSWRDVSADCQAEKRGQVCRQWKQSGGNSCVLICEEDKQGFCPKNNKN